jgi:hypothetical protein
LDEEALNMFGFMTPRRVQPGDRRPLFRPRLELLEDRSVASSVLLTAQPDTGTVDVTETVTLTAYVSETAGDNLQPGKGSPPGTVTFFDNGTPLAVMTVTPRFIANQGIAVFSTSKLPPGTHSFFAAYSGEMSSSPPGSLTTPSDSNALALTVLNQAPAGLLTRAYADGFNTAYGVASGNLALIIFGVADYLAATRNVPSTVQQQLATTFVDTFYFNSLLLLAAPPPKA